MCVGARWGPAAVNCPVPEPDATKCPEPGAGTGATKWPDGGGACGAGPAGWPLADGGRESHGRGWPDGAGGPGVAGGGQLT